MTATVPPSAEEKALTEIVMHMSLGRYLVLKALQKEPSQMTALAKVAGISTAGMTGTRDAMERQGLMEEGQDPEGDRRKVVIQLTDKGAKAIALYESLLPKP